MPVLSAALLVLGAALLTISLLPAPAPEVVLSGRPGGGPAAGSAPAGPLAAGPVRLAVEAAPAAPAVHRPGRARSVVRAALSAPVDWDKTQDIETIDTDPGGALQFDPVTGRVRACARNDGDHIVRGYVIVDGREAVSVSAPKSKCDEAEIPGYKRNGTYKFKVCLSRSEAHPDGYCNTSDSAQWPKEDKKNNSCWDLKTEDEKIDCVGGAEEYCNQAEHGSGMFPKACEKDHEDKKTTVLRPPKGRTPDINAKPDAALPRGHAQGVESITQPVEPLLRWLLWSTLTACVAGVILVGASMALKHKRGEFGAQAAGLGWVMIACVMAGSGLAIAFVGLLVDPF
ncbi:hypothetical protein GWI34_35670 [Actinomadura sp. DSM 109109]|nr:hypothetical protein [Actinomadura lepetitiana]